MQSFYLADQAAFLRYLDLPGKEPVCVYIHGLGAASSADFPAIAHAPRLAPYRALLIDLLGFGYSDGPPAFSHTFEAHATVVARLLDKLGLRNCLLIGHSLGGSIAIALAAARPDLLSGLVVAEPSLDADDAFFSGTIVARWPTEAEYLARGHAAVLAEESAEACTAPSSASAGNYVGTFQAVDPRAVYRSCKALVVCSLRETFFALSLPRTYVYGARTLPHRHELWLAESDVKICVIPDAGHDMPADNPREFAGVLARTIGCE
jgi:pimeloyl-ACP methyl ester carboxylesterase